MSQVDWQGSVVVTGAGQGIGRATLDRLRIAGLYCVGVERDADLAAELGDALAADGAAVGGDVTDRQVLEEAATLAGAAAPLVGWVNNAGISMRGTLHAPVEADVERVLAVNLLASFWGCSTAVRTFVEQRSGGSIVNVSSIHARHSFPESTAYEMSKGGVEALTRSVAVSYGPLGIRCNGVAPGGVRTPMLEASLAEVPDPDAIIRVLEGSPPLKRSAAASEVASAIAFLLSAESAYVTGQTLPVDGGWSVSLLPASVDEALAERYGIG